MPQPTVVLVTKCDQCDGHGNPPDRVEHSGRIRSIETGGTCPCVSSLGPAGEAHKHVTLGQLKGLLSDVVAVRPT